MEIYLLIISDTRGEWGQLESFVFTDKTSAQIKMNEYYNFAKSLPEIEDDEIYYDPDGFDVFFNGGGKYFGQIKKDLI